MIASSGGSCPLPRELLIRNSGFISAMEGSRSFSAEPSTDDPSGAGALPTLLALIAAYGAAACSTLPTRTPAERTADAAMAAEVESVLRADPNIYARHIDVARSIEVRRRARRICLDEPGSISWLKMMPPRCPACVPSTRRWISCAAVSAAPANRPQRASGARFRIAAHFTASAPRQPKLIEFTTRVTPATSRASDCRWSPRPPCRP